MTLFEAMMASNRAVCSLSGPSGTARVICKPWENATHRGVTYFLYMLGMKEPVIKSEHLADIEAVAGSGHDWKPLR